MNGALHTETCYLHLDAPDCLPPMQKKKKRKGRASLQTISAPLSPNTSTDLAEITAANTLVQHPSRLGMTTGRAPTVRRATVSETGQVPDGLVDVKLQLGPVLDRCKTTKEHSSKSVDFDNTATPLAALNDNEQQPAAVSASASLGPPQQLQQQLSRPASAVQLQTALPASAGNSSRAAAVRELSVHPPQQQQVPGTRSTTLQPVMSLEQQYPDPPPSLWDFFHAEATPGEKYPTADVLWRQTERDRVYNFLLHVPYQLERIMIFGTLMCLYSFLGALTILPLRCLRTVWQLTPFTRHPQPKPPTRSSSSSSSGMLPGAQLYDLMCVLLLLAAVGMLSMIKPGVIYYWMKDITSEFLKIQVIFTALEILDKILSNFGVDVLEALSSTCTLFTRHSIGLMQLVSDFLVALLLITAHGGVLLCQAMVFAVTMNSKANALLALMIATNFVELKGQVYKRTDTNKLWSLACQDIVERFELLLVLGFVVVEEINNSSTWVPATAVLLVCARIFMWEIIIDIAKHAVLGKFNDIRPGIYREYMRDLCSDSLDKHSHNSHMLVGFCPLGPAALALRMVHTLFTLKANGHPNWPLRAAVILLLWLAACMIQVMLGFSLKWLAYLYVQHHAKQSGGKTLPRAINVTPAGAKIPPPAAAAAAVASKGPLGSNMCAGLGGSVFSGAAGAAEGSTGALQSPKTAVALMTGPPPVANGVAAGAGVVGDPSTASAGLTESKSLTEVSCSASDTATLQPAAHSDEGASSSSNRAAGSSTSDPGEATSSAAVTSNVSRSSLDRPTAAVAGVRTAVGHSSGYAAPSVAGLSQRVHTRVPSIGEVAAHG